MICGDDGDVHALTAEWSLKLFTVLPMRRAGLRCERRSCSVNIGADAGVITVVITNQAPPNTYFALISD
jgi:hypothetical protein